MTAILTSCTLYKNADGSVDRYEIGFTSDLIPAGMAVPIVNIRASDVDDINDMNEVKEAAFAKIALMETFAQKSVVQKPQNVQL